MKKILFIVSMVLTGAAHAQYTGTTTIQEGTLIVSLNEGINTVVVANVGKFTLRRAKTDRFLNAMRFSEVKYIDSSGKVFNLVSIQPGSEGAPKPACATPLPDACFATADKKIGLCICKPANLSTGENSQYRVAARVLGIKKL